MGNKSSRRKSTGDNLDGGGRTANNRSSGGGGGGGMLRRKNSKRNSIDPNSASPPPAATSPTAAANDKHRSCPPQMGGAVPYQFEEERHINVTLYRSYRNLNTSKFGSLRDSTPDIRVYRRSTGSLAKLASSTLPRNFGRSKSAIDTPLCQLAKAGSTSNGVLGGKGLGGSKRLSTSTTSTHKPVSASDFPSTAEIRRKLSLFEDRFCRALADRYSGLPETVQLAALPIAFERRGDKSLSAVSLYDYFHNDDLPTDLTAGAARDIYIPVIPAALLHGIAHVRRDKIANRKLWTSLAGDVIMCIALEAAAELARIYEYQIGLLGERTAVEMVAAHAAECVLQYVVSEKTSMDRNSAILGVTRATPPRPNGSTAVRISVIVGDNELKWDVHEIFKKPGLRTDVNLLAAEHVGKYVDGGVSPWKYYTTSFHDAGTYGYRGQVLEWDYVSKAYKTSVEDEYFYLNQTAPEQSDQDDLHRRYRPYMRLVGYDVMLAYAEATASGDESRSLAEYLRMPADDDFGRRDVKPVYRPTASAEPRAPLPLQRAILDGADLTRIQLPDADCAADLRARNARMMLAEVAAARIADSAGVSGADVSYSSISGRTGPLGGVTAKHVSLSESVEVNGDAATNDSGAVMGSCASRVSDGDGKVSTVYEAVERKQRRLEAAEKAAQAEARARIQSGSSGSIPETRGGRQTRNGKAGNFSRVPDHVRMSEPQLRLIDSIEERRQRAIKALQTQPLGRQKQTGKTPTQPGVNNDRQTPRAVSVSNPHLPPDPDPIDTTIPTNPTSGSPPLIRRERALTQQQERSLSTTYINATRADAVTSSVGCARITKSVSQHGPLAASAGKTTGGSIERFDMQSGRRVLSHAELEYIRRSQIFRMIRKIHVNNMEGRLPAVRTPFVGRAGEVTSLTDLLDTSGRLITVTGGAGCGKSQLAIVTAHAVVAKYHVTAVYVDARGCATRSAVCRRLQELFDLHMREMEMRFLCNWFNSHEQRLLFVFDNVDPATSRDAGHVSEFIDELAAGVRDVRVLCTSRRAFYVGSSAAATSFALGDLRQDSENLLRQLTPDLHDDGIRNLADACGHVVQALMVASRGLIMPEVDAGQLFEDLTTGVTSSDEQEESEEETSRRVLTCLRHVLGHTGEAAEGLLRDVALFASWFDQSAASEVGTIADKDALATTLSDLARVGFLESRTRNDVDVYYVPHNARLLANSLGGTTDGATRYTNYILGRMRTLQELYYSPECGDALQQFSDMADDIDAFLRSTIERGTAYRDCGHLAAIDPAVFLHETLPSMLFEELFSAIRDGSEADSSTKCRALCCLSYQESGRGDFTAAKRAMTVAHDVTGYLAEVDDLTKAFCYECLSLVYWSEPDRQDPALALMKRALDVYKMALGMRSARTLLANEHYGAMLARRARLQSARHFFNVSDFAIAEVLDAHALLVRSYDERRAIWDALQLYGRSVEAAKKAADIARRYQGEHPLTANMLAKLCDAVMRRGSLHEAIDAATDTLHLRLKVLGDHDDTAASYKVLAYLMVRSGQYDEAIRFAQAALDIHAKGDEAVTDERRQVELKNLISQARYRLEYKSSVFVQIESKDASRPNVNSSARSGEPRVNDDSGATNGKHRVSINDSAVNGEQRVNGDHTASNGKTRVISNHSSVTNGESGVNKHSSASIDETSVNRVCAMSTEV